MATATRSKRTFAPKANTKTEASVTPAPVSAPKTSIWTRIKTTATKAAAVIAKPFKSAAKKITPATKKVVATVKTTTAKVVTAVKTATKSIAAKAAPVVRKFWHLALKPLLAGVAGGAAVFGLLLGAIAAPFTTALLLCVAAGGVLLLGLGVKRLEETEETSRFSRILLKVLEVIAKTGVALVYTVAAVVTAVMCLASLTFTIFIATFLTLSYLQVRGAASIAFIVWGAVSGNWSLVLLWTLVYVMRAPARTPVADAVPEYSEIRRKPEAHVNVRRAPVHETANVDLFNKKQPAGNFLRAQGTEELWHTEHDVSPDVADPNWAEVWTNDQPCTACGTTAGAMRVATDGPVATHGLCDKCFALQCEEDAIRFTGVSLKTRSVEVRLNAVGIAASPSFAASKFDVDNFHWMESAWWRDRAGTEYARERICLVGGREVARVVHDYKRKVYRASVLGQLVRGGVKTTWELAQSVAQDELNDEQAAVRRHEEAADEVIGEAPVRLQPQRA